MTIGHIYRSLSLGGMQRGAGSILKVHHEMGHDLVVYTREPVDGQEYGVAVPFRRVVLGGGSYKRRADDERKRLLREELAAHRPDLVIHHEYYAMSVVDDLEILHEAGIPVLSSMGAALRTDPARIRFGKLTDVTHCRLSMMLRKRIRRKGVNTDRIPCVYSTEPVREIRGAGAILPPSVSEDDPRLHGRRRGTLGSLPTITGIFGLVLANQAVMRLTDGNRET